MSRVVVGVESMLGVLGKPGWMLTLLAGAFVIPYVLCDQRISGAVKNAFSGNTPSTAAAGEPGDVAGGNGAFPDIPVIAAGPPTPLCDMATAFRFDITSQQVTATWPKVSTVAGDTSHTGLRVPLVTGVMPDDVAGTLTYYYDSEPRLQRITFRGTTGDPRRLVALITSQYGLQPQPTLDAGLYQSKWSGKVISTLHVRRAPVVSAASIRSNYEVQLDLRRADALAGTAGKPRRMFGW